MTINPINLTTAHKFSGLWQHSEFYYDYTALTKTLNDDSPHQKLVRFFDDLNRDLKLYLQDESNQGKACAIIRIIDYQYRIMDMSVPTEQFDLIYKFLFYLKMSMIKFLYKGFPEYPYATCLLKKRNDPHFYNRNRK